MGKPMLFQLLVPLIKLSLGRRSPILYRRKTYFSGHCFYVVSYPCSGIGKSLSSTRTPSEGNSLSRVSIALGLGSREGRRSKRISSGSKEKRKEEIPVRKAFLWPSLLMVECSQDMWPWLIEMRRFGRSPVNEVKEKSPLPQQLALFPERRVWKNLELPLLVLWHLQ